MVGGWLFLSKRSFQRGGRSTVAGLFRLGAFALVVIALLSIKAVARPVSASFSFIHPRVEFGEGWKASLVLVNGGQKPTSVRLVAYDANGNLLGEFRVSPDMVPGERKVYSREDGAWPQGTASLKLESDTPLHSFVMLESVDGKALEAILPAAETNSTLTLSQIGNETSWWSHFILMNTGPAATGMRVVAVDRNGNVLAETLLPTLSSMASTTVVVGDLLPPAIISDTAVVQIVADQPLAGVQLFGSGDEADVAALPTLATGQQLFLPVFQEGEGVALWTMVGLFNPRDGPVNITIEAFDAQQRPLAVFSDQTSLPARSSHYLLSSNIGGSLPLETAFLTVTAGQPIGGYAVIGAMQSQGLTTVSALTEHDSQAGYDLVGSSDGRVLAALPFMRTEKGGVQSAFGQLDADLWRQTTSSSMGNPEEHVERTSHQEFVFDQQALSVSNPELVQAVSDFKKAITNKINLDVDRTAMAFTDARDLQRSLFWSDIFQPLLDIAEAVLDGLGLGRFSKGWSAVSWIWQGLETANKLMDAWSFGASMDKVQQHGENLALAISGPAYNSAIQTMLDRADQTGFPIFGFNYTEYKNSISFDLEIVTK